VIEPWLRPKLVRETDGGMIVVQVEISEKSEGIEILLEIADLDDDLDDIILARPSRLVPKVR
jgi:hypothetical protein